MRVESSLSLWNSKIYIYYIYLYAAWTYKHIHTHTHTHTHTHKHIHTYKLLHNYPSIQSLNNYFFCVFNYTLLFYYICTSFVVNYIAYYEAATVSSTAYGGGLPHFSVVKFQTMLDYYMQYAMLCFMFCYYKNNYVTYNNLQYIFWLWIYANCISCLFTLYEFPFEKCGNKI